MRLTDTLVEEGLTVRETISDFLSDCELRSLAAGTIEWYRQRLGSLLADILDQPISALSLPEIRERIRGVQNMHSASTVKGYVRAVKTFCYWSLRE